MTLFDKIGSPGQQVNWETRRHGVDLAKISNIDDPDKLNRVKCKLLSEDKKEGETDWCFVMTPFGSKDHGIFFHPNVGDIVVLAYFGADVHRPCVIGSVWTQDQKAPYKIENAKNNTYSIKTPNKSEIVFNDEKEKECITVVTPKGNTFVIDDEKQSISIMDKDKKNHMIMALDKGQIEIVAEKKLVLKSGNASIELDSTGNVIIKGKTKIDMDTATFKVKATGQAQIEAGGSGTFKGNGSVTVQSSGITTVKGSMVKIN